MRVRVIAVDNTAVTPTAKVRPTTGGEFFVPIDKSQLTWWGARIGTEVLLNPTEVSA